MFDDAANTQWYQALCGRPPVQPIPTQETGAALYARSLRNTPRVLRTEGIPTKLWFSEITATSFQVTAYNEGSPLRTELTFTRMFGDSPQESRAMYLDGGPGMVVGELVELLPNTRYQFTLSSYFQYNSSDKLRTYTPTDLRNYPAVYSVWTHGPPIVRTTLGRMIRFDRSAVNEVRPSIQPFGAEAMAPITESVVYYVLFVNRGDSAIRAEVGPITSNTAYAPPELPPGKGKYDATVKALYIYSGYPAPEYVANVVSSTMEW